MLSGSESVDCSEETEKFCNWRPSSSRLGHNQNSRASNFTSWIVKATETQVIIRNGGTSKYLSGHQGATSAQVIICHLQWSCILLWMRSHMLRKSELKTRFAKLQIQVFAVKRTYPTTTMPIYQIKASSHQAQIPQMPTKLQRLSTKPNQRL